MIEARLGRGAQDVLEAAVVLEAWGGMRANSALSLGSRVVPPKPPRWTPGRLTTEESGHRESIITEAIALIMAILAVASWAGPLGRQVGTSVLTQAIVIALPTTLALAVGDPQPLPEPPLGLHLAVARSHRAARGAILGIEVPLMLLSSYGPLAGMFVAIWVGGTILSRRGWGLFYGLLLVGTVFALQADLPAYPLLLGLTAIIVIGAVTAIRTSHERSNEPAGRLGRALWAGAMGAALGGLLVGDSSLGWGVHGAFPALALLPSIFGSFWGGYHLWQFYDAVPRGLQGAGLEQANERSVRGPAMRVFLGAVGRLVLLTVVLSVLVVFISQWTSGTSRLSLFIGFGCVALLTMLINVLESLAYVQWALMSAVAALVTELVVVDGLSYSPVPGTALIAGTAVGILVALPPLLALLLRPGRVLATSLWIQ